MLEQALNDNVMQRHKHHYFVLLLPLTCSDWFGTCSMHALGSGICVSPP